MKHLLLIIALCLYSHSTQAGNCPVTFRLSIALHSTTGTADTIKSLSTPYDSVYIYNNFSIGDSVVISSPYNINGFGCTSYIFYGIISFPVLYKGNVLIDTLDFKPVNYNYLSFVHPSITTANRDYHWHIYEPGIYYFYYGSGTNRPKRTIIINDNATGVNNSVSRKDIKIYLNTENNVLIRTQLNVQNVQAKIYNANGAILFNHNNVAVNENTKINLAHLPQGIYFCSISYFLNEKHYTYTEKIVRL